MKIVVLQGLNHNVGVSSIASSITYSLAKLGNCTVCVDANIDASGNSIGNLFGLENCKSGWLNSIETETTLENNFNKSPVFYQYEEKAFFLALGSIETRIDDVKAMTLTDKLFNLLKQYQKVDYLIIDAGVKGSPLAKAFSSRSDMTITILEAEGNSLFRLNASRCDENEYLLVNKFMKNSSVMADISLLLNNTKHANCFLKHTISFDESVMNAYMRQMPVSRFLHICSASLDIEKILIDIMLICSNAEVA